MPGRLCALRNAGVRADPDRRDPAVAKRLLGPALKYEPTQLHTNRGDGEPGKPKSVTATEKVGRNGICPCGSGEKYKKCHGAAA
jgi:hypothetical protein